MKIIEKLCEQIEEEINDAHKYIECALTHKEDFPSVAEMYRRLATEEVEHANKLHQCVTEVIQQHKSGKAELPERMQWIYEYLHDKHVKRLEEVKILIASY